MTEGQTLVIGERVDEDALANGQGDFHDPIEPPDISDSKWGVIGSFLKYYRTRRKVRKYANEGYVRWYVIDGGWPDAKIVKPEYRGGGIPEYEYDGETYLFPDRAQLADTESGMWTVIHKRGEAEPLNLRDPTEESVKADELDEYLTKRVTTSPPSFWDKFDFDADDILMYLIAAIVGVALLQQFLGGGF